MSAFDDLLVTADAEQRNFILDLYNQSIQTSQSKVERRLLETKRGLTRARSNQIFKFWLMTGLVEGDPFGSLWLSDRGLAALTEYHEGGK